MTNLSKTNAIVVGLTALLLVLFVGSVLMTPTRHAAELAALKEERANVKAAKAEPEIEWNVAIDCPKYFDEYNRAGKYEEIGAVCFNYFNITDEMLERRLQRVSYERELNPCNN